MIEGRNFNLATGCKLTPELCNPSVTGPRWADEPCEPDRLGGNVLRLVIVKEAAVGETRVALLPDAVKKLIANGLEVAVEAGAGVSVGHL